MIGVWVGERGRGDTSTQKYFAALHLHTASDGARLESVGEMAARDSSARGERIIGREKRGENKECVSVAL